MDTLYIKKSDIAVWWAAIKGACDHVVAPVRKDRVVEFARVENYEEIATDYIQTTRSAKEVLFPRTERLFSYQKKGRDVEVNDFDASTVPTQVLWQVRPCDAASVFPLDAVFNWDYKDVMYNTRRERTTIVAVSCATADEYCFCTSVGGGPGDVKGSDILLTYTADGAIVEVVTERGEKLVALSQNLFTVYTAGDKDSYLANVLQVFDVEKLKE